MRATRRKRLRATHPAPGINVQITAGDVLADLMWPNRIERKTP